MTTLRNASGRMVPPKCYRPAALKRHRFQRENLAVAAGSGTLRRMQRRGIENQGYAGRFCDDVESERHFFPQRVFLGQRSQPLVCVPR